MWLSKRGDVEFELEVPSYVQGSFTYTIVVTEGYASQPSMVKAESVVIVSAKNLRVNVHFPIETFADGLLTEAFFQVYAEGETKRSVEIDEAELLKDGEHVMWIDSSHRGRGSFTFEYYKGSAYKLKVSAGG